MERPKLRLISGDLPPETHGRKKSARVIAGDTLAGLEIEITRDGAAKLCKRLSAQQSVHLILVTRDPETGDLEATRRHREFADQFFDLWSMATRELGCSVGDLVFTAFDLAGKTEGPSMTYTGTQLWLRWAWNEAAASRDAGGAR